MPSCTGKLEFQEDGILRFIRPYVQSADLERREWEKVRRDEDDPTCQHFNIFGQLAAS